MHLPNPDRAFVDPAKVREYLLSATHPVGRRKAAAFVLAGYRPNQWAALHRDLLATAWREVDDAVDTPYGRKFVVSAILGTAGGRSLPARVVWIVRNGEDFPRLVTAHPWSRRP